MKTLLAMFFVTALARAGDDQAQRAGAKLFAHECAPCHGRNREGGGKAPSLKRPEITQAPPEHLLQVLRDGIIYHGMPSFAHLPGPQRRQIVEFLQSHP